MVRNRLRYGSKKHWGPITAAMREMIETAPPSRQPRVIKQLEALGHHVTLEAAA